MRASSAPRQSPSSRIRSAICASAVSPPDPSVDFIAVIPMPLRHASMVVCDRIGCSPVVAGRPPDACCGSARSDGGPDVQYLSAPLAARTGRLMLACSAMAQTVPPAPGPNGRSPADAPSRPRRPRVPARVPRRWRRRALRPPRRRPLARRAREHRPHRRHCPRRRPACRRASSHPMRRQRCRIASTRRTRSHRATRIAGSAARRERRERKSSRRRRFRGRYHRQCLRRLRSRRCRRPPPCGRATFTTSFPRKREASGVRSVGRTRQRHRVPAFAGTTGSTSRTTGC